MISIEYLLVGVSTLLLLSVLASKASGGLGIPAVLLFLVIGMLAGSEGPGGIYFYDARLAQSLGVVALALILFAGGLDTDWAQVRPVLAGALALSTVGVFLTTLLLGGFAVVGLGFSPLEGLLLGAVLSSTDAAAVFAVMRGKGVGLKNLLKPIIELESGSNDPMAVFLTIGLIRLITVPRTGLVDMIGMFTLQMSLGGILGYAMGRAMVALVNFLGLEYEGLYPVLSLALALMTWGIVAWLGGSGFLAVYVAGLTMGNSNFVHKRSLIRFHDGVAWLMQITMFLTMGLLVFPSQLLAVLGAGALVAAFLIAFARPVSVLIALAFSKMDLREKIIISWAGLRGAAPIILATFPLLAGVPKADMIFNLVFFTVLASVLLQGTTIPLVARYLGVDTPSPARYHYPLEFVPSVTADSQLIEILVRVDSPLVGKSIMQLQLPAGALIVMLNRDNESMIPNGGTVLEAGDKLSLLVDKEALPRVRAMAKSSGAASG